MKVQELKAATENHDRLNCGCTLCEEYDKAEYEYKRGLHLTTDHAASSYGIPVLVDAEGIAYGVKDMTPIGWALTLYHNIASRDGWDLQWEDFGNTLVGVREQGK